MYFEFEISTNNESLCDSKQTNNNSPENSQSSASIGNKANLYDSSSLLSLSPLATNQSSTPIKSTFAYKSPIISPPPRHRRYSVQSSQSLFTLDSLHDNDNVTFCDLALITKKKLLQLNGSYIKTLNENQTNPDIKLTQPFNKHSNNDLRREVLLASIQRSLSASSEDLFNLSSSSSKNTLNDTNISNSLKINEDNLESSMDFVQSNSIISNKPLITNDEIQSSLINSISNGNDDLMNDFSSCQMEMRRLQFPSRIKARRSQNLSYTPAGNHNNCMSSLTTFTSTTSMAGSKNIINNPNNCRNKKLNALNLMGNSSSVSTYSNSPKLAMTMTSSQFNSPFKKRLHSTSPSKYSSPYHTVSNSICKDFNLIFANSNNQLPSDWDMAFKRLKVMHCANADASTSDGQCGQIDQASNLINNSLELSQFTPNRPESDLNELAQDFHRLKTPFI